MSNAAQKLFAPGDMDEVSLTVTGMDCPNCAAHVGAALRALDGVIDADIAFAAGKAVVKFDPLKIGREQFVQAIRACGYDVRDEQAEAAGPRRTLWQAARQHRRLITTAVAFVLLATAWAVHLSGRFDSTLHIGLYLAATVVGGSYVARAAARSLAARRLDMNVLMSIAVIGAVAIGYWSEAATVTFLFALSLWLEHMTMDRARHAIRSLLKLKPDRVRVIDERGREQWAAPEQVAVGQAVQVRPSERIGLDGVVVEGASSVDQSAVTGESAPAAKSPGDEVLAGTINQEATLTLRVTRAAGESTISRIIQLVEQAQAARAPAQRFVDKFARIYTPLVVAAAVLVAAVPPLLFGQPFLEPAGAGLGHHGWLYRSLVLLVISCPCALVISTPVSVVSALASAARRGVLIKGGVHLETLGRVHCVVFDKTGTLTLGHPVVTDVLVNGQTDASGLLRIAAALESHSEHHLARAILRRAREAGVGWSEPAEIKVLPGRGLAGQLNGDEYWLGNRRLAGERGADLGGFVERIGLLESEGKTVVLLGGRGGLIGLIAVADQVRPEAREALDHLRRANPGLHGRGGAAVDEQERHGDAETRGRGERGGGDGVRGRGGETATDRIAHSGVPAPIGPPAHHRAHLVMLTGDNRPAARAVAEQLGIDSYAAELLPDEKVREVRRLALDCTGAVAMVGDGINDAPALAAADLGIAMGTAGTDAALQTADIALIGDDLAGVPFAVRLGRSTRRVIAQNVWFAIAVKAVFFALAVGPLPSLWLAVIADMGASLLVTANGLRLLRVRR